MESSNRISVSPLSTADLGLTEDLALYDRLGVRRTGLSIDKLVLERDFGHALAQVAGADVQIDLVYPHHAVNLADKSTWEAGRDSLDSAIDVAAETNASGVLFAGGSAYGLPWEEAVSAFQSLVAPVAKRADRCGVRLLLEPLRPQFAHLGFVHSLRDGVGLARESGLGIVVDVTHCWWEPRLLQTLQDNVDLIGIVQLADLRFDQLLRGRFALGEGNLPLKGIIGCLLESDYGGAFEIELIGAASLQGGAEAALRRSIDHLDWLLS